MRLTPATKVFLYLLTMADATDTCTDPVWQERYHLDPVRTIAQLERRGVLTQAVGGPYTLTTAGQTALGDIADWLWIHEYYLPDVIDFARARRGFWQPKLTGYPLLQELLSQAKHRFKDDTAYMAVLLRHELRLEYETQHDLAAIQTLMALIDQDLDIQRPCDPATFSYHTTWAKVTEFEKQMLKTLLSRLNWTLADFEMRFSEWLETQPRTPRLFTRLELMTIVMYELANNTAKLVWLYEAAAARNQGAAYLTTAKMRA
ncbi:hypothetical protein [Lacticaseibacillus daqingensis]|uniref:hypothetical protein n=1 Tax=Lacticaseibacillus daqingensis TaxID=2486014 RepID=UPI000F79B315|nr:hypothetical protein [Lacticaseibacillus daqingensis]